MNGDNSIRLIYSGISPEIEGNDELINSGFYRYNTKYGDPTYIGYMYGEDDTDFNVDESSETEYVNILPDTKYYFADNYVKDDETKTFKLSGNIVENPKTFKEMNDLGDEGLKKYLYTCLSTNLEKNCQVLIKIKKYNHETSINANLLTYGSANLETTKLNNKSSEIKNVVDTWYETYIKNKTDDYGNLLESYIVDGSFCNDRSFAKYNNSGNGYSSVPATIYRAYETLAINTNKSATLTCDIKDKFSTTSSYGNASLTYPIALITADEAVLAGGKTDVKNEDFYLRTYNEYWTMTPTMFDPVLAALPRLFSVNNKGGLYPISYVAPDSYNGVRPVINISPDVLISEGDGTIDNPFKLKLA